MAIEDQKLFRNGIEAVLKENPENRCCKYALQYLATEEGQSLSDEGLLKRFSCLRFLPPISTHFIHP